METKKQVSQFFFTISSRMGQLKSQFHWGFRVRRHNQSDARGEANREYEKILVISEFGVFFCAVA